MATEAVHKVAIGHPNLMNAGSVDLMITFVSTVLQLITKTALVTLSRPPMRAWMIKHSESVMTRLTWSQCLSSVT